MHLYGLIGRNPYHSWSKAYFDRKFTEEKLTGVFYQIFSLDDISELPDLLKREKMLKGLNVTTPFKEKIIPYLDKLDETAKKIGAVNVIRIHRNRRNFSLEGFNSDAPAFMATLRPLLRDHHKAALVLGSGGASKAIQYALEKLNLPYQLVSRESGKGKITYENLDRNIVSNHHIIINTTPRGMFPEINDYPDIPYEGIDHRHLLYDLIYNPEETIFISKGQKAGAITKNGLEMLHLQAHLSWKIWQPNP